MLETIYPPGNRGQPLNNAGERDEMNIRELLMIQRDLENLPAGMMRCKTQLRAHTEVMLPERKAVPRMALSMNSKTMTVNLERQSFNSRAPDNVGAHILSLAELEFAGDQHAHDGRTGDPSAEFDGLIFERGEEVLEARDFGWMEMLAEEEAVRRAATLGDAVLSGPEDVPDVVERS